VGGEAVKLADAGGQPRHRRSETCGANQAAARTAIGCVVDQGDPPAAGGQHNLFSSSALLKGTSRIALGQGISPNGASA